MEDTGKKLNPKHEVDPISLSLRVFRCHFYFFLYNKKNFFISITRSFVFSILFTFPPFHPIDLTNLERRKP